MIKRFVGVVVSVLVVLLSVAAFAQEDDVEFGYGTVVTINGDTKEIVISEYNWDTDAEVDVAYSVRDNVEVESASSWKDIPKGSYIDFEYVIESTGKKAIKYISVYEVESSEPETETMTEESE